MSDTSGQKTQQQLSVSKTLFGCMIIIALIALIVGSSMTIYDAVTADSDDGSSGTSTGLVAEIAALPVAAEREAGYDRDLFGDYDRDRILDRNERRFAACRGFYSRYDDECYRSPDEVHADHTVPMSEAWKSGAWQWDEDRRATFAADPANLALMTAGLNMSKSDADPAEWLPEHRRCAYVEVWVEIKSEYQLTVDRAERDALTDVAESCD